MELAAQQLNLTLSGAKLLHDVDLVVQAGQVTAVLGPNGAGKTSLLRVLCGDLAADSGSVTLGDKPVDAWSPRERAALLSILPQQSALSFPFTAREVVMLGRIPHGSGVARDREIVAAALERVDGDYLADREYTRLSGGEKQRVHLARVLAQIWEPLAVGDRFLLLDEPTASFDLAHQRMTQDIVAQLSSEGVGVFMILHDLNLAARCADQLVLMQCGHIRATGTPDQVLTAETIRQVFNVDVRIGRHPDSGVPLVMT